MRTRMILYNDILNDWGSIHDGTAGAYGTGSIGLNETCDADDTYNDILNDWGSIHDGTAGAYGTWHDTKSKALAGTVTGSKVTSRQGVHRTERGHADADDTYNDILNDWGSIHDGTAGAYGT
ncbi:unnamed protein product [Clavelina lepadiformis]|uniref:Uncharacterized protein n=1 Tax=Clavelina lepadiformis TaxID=159417 RepID=A0ABP0GY72_CLALP